MSIFGSGVHKKLKGLMDRLNNPDLKLPENWFWWDKKKDFFSEIDKTDIEILHLLRLLHASRADRPDITERIIYLVKELDKKIKSMEKQQATAKQAEEARLVNRMKSEISVLLQQEFPQKRQNNGIVSIITSMYNKNHETIDVIRNLFFRSLIANHPENPRLAEIIIVDDGSPLQKETEELIKEFRPRLLAIYGRVIFFKNPSNLGFSRSFNRGIKAAKGDILLIVNDDIYLTAHAIDRLASFILRNADFGAVGPITRDKNIQGYQHLRQGPRIRSYDERELDRIERFSSSLGSLFSQKIKEIHTLGGFCFVTRRDVIEDVGLFDERFRLGYYDDTDLMHRINMRYKLGVMMDLYVHHGDIKGSSVSMRTRRLAQAASITRNAFLLIGKHGLGFYLRHMYIGLRSVYGGRSVSNDYKKSQHKAK